MKIDFGGICPEQLEMILDEALDRYGVETEIVSPDPFDNEYAEIGDGEVQFPKEADGSNIEPSISTRVLLSKPVEGLLLDHDFISYADKIETQYSVTCKERFKREDRLDLTWPDGRLMSLRIIEPPKSIHPFTTVWFRAIGVVTDRE